MLADPKLHLRWPPAFLVDLIRPAATGDGSGIGAYIPQNEHLQTVCWGMEIDPIRSTGGEEGPALRLFPENVSIEMSLAIAGVQDFRAVELMLALSGPQFESGGRLQINYGQGFSEATTFVVPPNKQGIARLFLLAPERIRGLAWSPPSRVGTNGVRTFFARPVYDTELRDLTKPASGGSGLDVSEMPIHEIEADRLVQLSNELSRLIYGYDAPARGEYARWISRNEPAAPIAVSLAHRRFAKLLIKPHITLILVIDKCDGSFLRQTIESVIGQAYQNWRLNIGTISGGTPGLRSKLTNAAARDGRVKMFDCASGAEVWQLANASLAAAQGDWVVRLDPNDILAPDALLSIVEEVSRHPTARMVYSDEDSINGDGVRSEPFFKPSFAPDLLNGQNYVGRLSAYRLDDIRAVGGWRAGFTDSEDYDLTLRVVEGLALDDVRHIPKVLYHRRVLGGEAAAALWADAPMSGIAALQDHLRRVGVDAEALKEPGSPGYRVRYRLSVPPPRVSLIIPTRDQADLLRICIDSVLQRTSYSEYEIIIIDNGSTEPCSISLLSELSANPQIKIISSPGAFNFSYINNLAVAEAKGEIIGLLNNDIEVDNSDWMREMASFANQPRIGCVGAMLYFPDQTIQHAGVVTGIGGVAAHPFKNLARGQRGYFSQLALVRNVSAVTAACVFIRKSVFDEVGGLDETFAVAFNDVDLCLRVRERGYMNVITPFAELIHHESRSRGKDDAPDKRARFSIEFTNMILRWGNILDTDPFYSPNLSLQKTDYSFRLHD